jgi:hypothetical protein
MSRFFFFFVGFVLILASELVLLGFEMHLIGFSYAAKKGDAFSLWFYYFLLGKVCSSGI